MATEQPSTDDLGLALPLHGVQWIEASAGTGKTFVVATLYARMVIEAGLPVPSLLAVTFTEAATAELRERLRGRLALALAIAEGRADAETPESRITALLVAAAIEREGQVALQRRLRLAVEAMDLAPIHTIHGFCRRALADHALEAGQPLLARAMVENERLLREEVATDFWRQCGNDSARTAVLLSLWKSPAGLAKDLRDLLAIDALRPEAIAFEPDSELDVRVRRARMATAATFMTHGEEARAKLREALAEGHVNKTYVKDEAVNPVWRALAAWAQSAPESDPAIDKLGNYSRSHLALRTNKNKTTPISPLFDTIDELNATTLAVEARGQQRRIALVHEARDFTRQRLDALKRERGLIGFDDMIRGVADALAGATGEEFAKRLRGQYRVALVDEFQDTDQRQWSIFHQLFANADDPDRALFLIGDPKQAIYRFRGGDVFTYLAARASADQCHALDRNYRSRPLVLTAVAALFGGANPFAQAEIAFQPVLPGGRVGDDDLQLDGQVLPGLNFERLSGHAAAGIEEARDAATTACVTRIHALLAAGLDGRGQRRDGKHGMRPVAPGDVAILVPTHKDAERIRGALSGLGIPCVAAGRRSLYDTDEADELRVLLHALANPADDRRLRAALAMPLLGATAADIRALDDDEPTHRHWQDRCQAWRGQCERHGLLALVSTLCADNAPRLLGLLDGERRLTNLLQLAEELQASRAARLGPAALLDELDRRVLAADAENDGELLRLESDAARVQILTLHKSKGLEFELVFLPYAATDGDRRNTADNLKLARYHDGEKRVAELFAESDSRAAHDDADEQRAEQLRLLYVGLTRARLATWVCWGATKQAAKSPLARLLHRSAQETPPDALDDATVAATLARLASPAIAITTAATELPTQRLSFAPPEATPPARVARRPFDREWGMTSFSQLAREDDGAEPSGAHDEPEPIAVATSRFSGARFGNALHAALEATDFSAWRDFSGELPPSGEYEHVAGALRGQGYASEADQLEGVPLLTRLVAATLSARLPEGAVLAQLSGAALAPELEFHLAFQPVALPELIATLHAHGIVADRYAFGLRRRIEGLLTGFIDLVYEHAGRYYVLDYKSNLLANYAPATLARSVRESEYDLQYTLYTLALHRWLRFRIGAAYDYDTHMGGVRYLYCRGLAVEGEGVHALTLPRALIESLDSLMAAPAPLSDSAHQRSLTESDNGSGADSGGRRT